MKQTHKPTIPWPPSLSASLETWYRTTLGALALVLVGAPTFQIVRILRTPPHVPGPTAQPHTHAREDELARNHALYTRTVTLLNAVPDSISLIAYSLTRAGALEIVAETAVPRAAQELIDLLQHQHGATISRFSTAPKADHSPTITLQAHYADHP